MMEESFEVSSADAGLLRSPNDIQHREGSVCSMCVLANGEKTTWRKARTAELVRTLLIAVMD